jgi:hypothetical protein
MRRAGLMSSGLVDRAARDANGNRTFTVTAASFPAWAATPRAKVLAGDVSPRAITIGTCEPAVWIERIADANRAKRDRTFQRCDHGVASARRFEFTDGGDFGDLFVPAAAVARKNASAAEVWPAEGRILGRLIPTPHDRP